MTKTNLIKDYWVLDNTYVNLMPFLASEELISLDSKEIMEYRIKAYETGDQSEIDFWLKHSWDTTDGLAIRHNKIFRNNSGDLESDPNREAVFIPHSRHLLSINSNSNVREGVLVISNPEFDELAKQYGILKKEDGIDERYLNKDQAKQSRFLLKLAREDKHLLNNYIDVIFSFAKDEKRIYKKGAFMSISFYPTEEPILNKINLRNHEGFCGIDDGYTIDDEGNRLIVISQHKTLEKIIK